jgi:hypothetical protein
MYSRKTGPIAARPSPPRENGVRPEPLSTNDLPEEDCATVAELRDEPAELMTRVRERDRLAAFGDGVAGEDLGGERLRVDTESLSKRRVDLDDPRFTHLGRRDARVELPG